MHRNVYRVEGMHCEGCARTIEALVGRVPGVKRVAISFGPGLARLSGLRGSAGLGVLFGLNIPACAAPLLAALLAAAAATGASGATVASGFIALAVFGFFLSARSSPLCFPSGHGVCSIGSPTRPGAFPKWTGLILIALDAWSIAFGLYVEVPLQ